MGEVVQLAKAERGDGRERYDDDGNWDVRMMLATDGGYEVTLVRTASPVTMAWWWDVRTSAGYDIVERSGRAFPTRREAKDAAWRAVRKLIAAGAKGRSP